MSKSKKCIGIVGGMGPAATVELMNRIVQQTPAKDDSEHLHMLVDSNTNIPSRIANLIEKTGKSPAPEIRKTAQKLISQGADVLAMPCNTAHYFYDEAFKALPAQFLNMLDIAIKKIAQSEEQHKVVGMLASTAVQITEVYQPYFKKYGIDVIYPNETDQDKVMSLIKSVKSNTHQTEQVDDYCQVTKNLRVKGADCLLVACTELSVVGFQDDISLAHYDALDLLVEEIIQTGLST